MKTGFSSQAAHQEAPPHAFLLTGPYIKEENVRKKKRQSCETARLASNDRVWGSEIKDCIREQPEPGLRATENPDIPECDSRTRDQVKRSPGC